MKNSPIVVGLLALVWGLASLQATAQQPYFMPPRPMPPPFYPGMPPMPPGMMPGMPPGMPPFPPGMPPFPPGMPPPPYMMGPGPMPMAGPMGPGGPMPMPNPYGPPPQMVMGPYGPMPAPGPGMMPMPPQQPGGPAFPNNGPDNGERVGVAPSPQDSEPPVQRGPYSEIVSGDPLPEILPATPGCGCSPGNCGHGGCGTGCPTGCCPTPGCCFPGMCAPSCVSDGCCGQSGCGQGGCGHHGGFSNEWGGCDYFPKGKYTFQMMGGWYTNTSLFGGKSAGQDYTFAPINLRWGKLCCWPNCHGLLRGAFEPIFELNGAPTLNGSGHFFAGTALMLRYNFVQPCCRIVPYVQAGAGVQYNDAYKDPAQTLLGQALTYSLNAQAGVRWFIKPWLSLDVEGGYIRLTNFNQATRDDGVNALGASVGLTYYFPTCCRGCYPH